MTFPPVPGGSTFLSARAVNYITPSGDQSGARDAADINAAVGRLPASGGTVTLAPGNWYLMPGDLVVELGNAQSVLILGTPGTVVNAVNGTTGAVIRIYNPGTQSGGLFSNRAGVKGLTIDGTNASDGAYGLQIGDVCSPQVDVTISNFSGAGSIGLYMLNSASWTEEGDIRAILYNCAQHAVLQVGAGNNSFGYSNLDFTVIAGSNQQSGVVLLDGALLYHATLRIRGDFSADVPATSAAVLSASGVNSSAGPADGDTCFILRCRLDIQVECGGGANAPMTVYLDPVNYAGINGCYGILDFGEGGGSFTPTSAQAGQLSFNGVVAGDANKAPALEYGANAGWFAVQNPVFYSYAAASGTGGAQTGTADFSNLILSSDVTVTLNVGNPTNGVPQRCTFVISQPASGGTYDYTVAWPSTGAPTTSSPTVTWPGGVTPVMSAGAGATDVYYLETIDGSTWYGRATQNMS